MFAVTFILVAVFKDSSGELELFRWTRDAASGIRRAENEGRKTFGPSWTDEVKIEARAA